MFLTYDLIDYKNFLSKSYSGHERCNVDKIAEKNFVKSPKIASLKFTKTLWKLCH